MNFGTPVPLLLGIFMVLCGVVLFFLDRLKPGYERDSDKIYAILFLLSGVFLLGNLNMDIILSFQQMLMVGMLVSLMIQNINSRT
ncbi:MAG: Ycf66 family protein, partial [Nodosilinea sp.]